MKKVLVYSIVAFWLFMAALFLRREVIPGLFAQPVVGYGSIRAYAQAQPMFRMGVYDDGLPPNRIGTAETTYLLKADGTCQISSSVRIDFSKHALFKRSGAWRHMAPHMDMNSETTVAPDDTLRSFRVICRRDEFYGLAYGRVRDGMLHVTVDLPGVHREDSIPVQRDDILSTGFMPFAALGRLEVGQAWRFKRIDPFGDTLEISAATARVIRETDLELGGQWYHVHEVDFSRGLTTAKAWVSESGDVLKQSVQVLMLQINLQREPLPHERGAAGPTTPPAGG